MFLILSAMTGLLECGSIFLGKCLGYSPGGVLSLCLAYQFGNLFPVPFCLRRATFTRIAYFSFIILCAARLTSAYPILQWIFYLLGIMLLSCTLQSIRAVLKVQTSRVLKRTARIAGFVLAPLMMYIPFLSLSVCCLAVLLSLKHVPQESVPTDSFNTFLKRMLQNDSYKIMLWHQLHYFIYAYAIILFIYRSTGKPFLTMLLFACTWLTYLSVEPIVGYIYRTKSKLADHANTPDNMTIILAGHTFLLLILILLPNVSGGIFIILWILSGFGGGTVFAISALCSQSVSYRKEELVFTENIGHLVGTAVAVIHIFLFPQNTQSTAYLSALCVIFVLLLTLKKQHSAKENKIESTNSRS